MTAWLLGMLVAILSTPSDPFAWTGEAEAADATAATGLVLPGIDAPIPFEGLGLRGFDGVGSIASELRRARERSVDAEAWALGMAVTGPGRTSRGAGWKLVPDQAPPPPLKALLKSRVQGVDVSAGLDANPDAIQNGAARWVGGVKVATEGSLGRAELAVNTSVRYSEASRLIGLELGPRYERSLPGGLTFFLDGKAEAETARSAEERIWTPSASNFDGFGSLGVVGRTGIVR